MAGEGDPGGDVDDGVETGPDPQATTSRPTTIVVEMGTSDERINDSPDGM